MGIGGIDGCGGEGALTGGGGGGRVGVEITLGETGGETEFFAPKEGDEGWSALLCDEVSQAEVVGDRI